MSDKIKVIAKERLFVQNTGEYIEVGQAVELEREKVDILLAKDMVEMPSFATQKQKGADVQPAKE